jgi:amidase
MGKWCSGFRRQRFLDLPGRVWPGIPENKVGNRLSYDGTETIYADYVWPFVACFNASGRPALQIPLGLGKEGLPLGVQIVGPYWSEPEMIAFAKLLAH